MSGDSLPRWAIGATAVVLMLAFSVAYNWGASSQTKKTEAPLSQMRVSIAQLQKKNAACDEKRLQGFRRSRGDNGTKALDDATAELQTLHIRETNINTQLTMCKDGLKAEEEEHGKMLAEAQPKADRLALLEERQRELVGQVRRIKSNMGVQQSMLFERLRMARRRHAQLLKKLKRDALNVPDLDAYDADLVEQYIKRDNLTESEIAKEVVQTPVEEVLNATAFLNSLRAFAFNPDTAKEVFLASNDGPQETADVTRPNWFGRTGGSEVVTGISKTGKNQNRVRTTAFVVRRLLSASLCAYRHNMSTMVYPATYRRESAKGPVEMLNNTIETPLATFCFKCKSPFNTTGFQMACRADRPSQLYGTKDFWVARSMIRPLPAIVQRARRVAAELQVADKQFLAVAFRSPKQLQAKCNKAMKPQLAFYWALARNKPSAAVVVDPKLEAVEQCAPTVDIVVKAVSAILANDTNLNAVYVSVDSVDDRAQLPKTIGPRNTPVVAYTPENGTQDIVDTIIASWASRVLLNRYSDHSMNVAESFALRNKLKATGIHFF